MQRYEIEGHLHYTTSVTNNRICVLLKDWACQIIIQTLNFYINRGDICLIGYVIMPDHLHMISLPKEEGLISNFLTNFHKFTAKEIIRQLNLKKDFDLLDAIKFDEGKKRKHQFRLWQGNSYDFNIISYDKLFEKLNYMHNNPLRKNIVSEIESYPYSSWHNYNDSKVKLVNIDVDSFAGM